MLTGLCFIVQLNNQSRALAHGQSDKIALTIVAAGLPLPAAAAVAAAATATVAVCSLTCSVLLSIVSNVGHCGQCGPGL